MITEAVVESESGILQYETLGDSEDDAPLEIAADRRRVRTDKLDVPVEMLYQWVKKGKLDLQPSFQRYFVWNNVKASRLVESLILEIPIPVIYMAEEPDGGFSVVDGQQRLTSICAYIDGKFHDGREFRLSSLQVVPELIGKRFQDLDSPMQEAINNASLRLIVIKADSQSDVKFEVFERLNLGAEKLNDQELRNSMYRGSYNDLLEQLTHNKYLRLVLGTDGPDKRMTDRQLILRFFAMWRSTHIKYKSPMKRFLNQEMERHRNPSKNDLGEMKKVFEKSIEMAFTVFGTHAFRRFHAGTEEHADGYWETNKLNVALWDTLLYSFSFHEKSHVIPVADTIHEEFLELLTTDQTFEDFVTSTTDKPERIRYRADVWRKRLERLVSGHDQGGRFFSYELKKSLFDKNPTCGICGQQIRHIDDAAVDHVEHYWKGGKTVPENARLTHRYCNCVRGGGELKATGSTVDGVLKPSATLLGQSPISPGSSTITADGWSEANFLARVGQVLGHDDVDVCRAVLEWSHVHAESVGGSVGKNWDYLKPFVLTTPKKRYAFSPWVSSVTGGIEIEFESLKTYPPFEDESLRRELQTRLNQIPGVKIPDNKLGGRPSIRFETLRDDGALQTFLSTFEWVFSMIRQLDA
jgi:Protein of unknown function DUF262/HNH endonuclease